MTPGPADDGAERFHLLSALFDEIRMLDPDARESILATRCGHDPALEGEVRALLRADGSGGGDRLVEQVLSAEVASIADLGAPERNVGPWRVVRRLGGTDSGAVFLADREEGGAMVRAVVRTFPSCADGADPRTDRFWRTFSRLRALDGEGLARVVGAGVDASGMPYVAVEVVAGRRLTEWCDRVGATIPERVRTFVTVCDILARAHALPVAHGAIRSSRIVVRDEGGPTVLDLGVAALAAACDGDRPEPTPTDDVHGLGCLLYELLTGGRPYGLQFGRAAPARPGGVTVSPASDRVDDPEARIEVEGALDAIVHRAVRADPSARYPTAAGLAEDLRRYLDGRPVLVSYAPGAPPRRPATPGRRPS